MNLLIDIILDLTDLTSMTITFDRFIIFMFVLCGSAGIISFLVSHTLGYLMLG